MKKTSCVFLCGDRSPYGLAHLEPIARLFDLRAIVIADTARWETFREALSGGERHEYSRETADLRDAVKRFARAPRTLYRWQQHRARLRAPGVPIFQINNANAAESRSRIQDFASDIVLSAAYPQILNNDVLESAPRGAVNFHPSLLPRCRGAHPHYWCLATGEKTGGVTAHYMTEEIDRGDILVQRSIDLTDLYYAELYERVVEQTPHLVEDVARFLVDPQARAIPQDESRATTFRNDRDVHRQLDFQRHNVDQLWNLVRAGRAHTDFRGVRIDVERANVVEALNVERLDHSEWSESPGTVAGITDSGVAVATADSESNRLYLVIETVRAGRRFEPFTRWIKSHGLRMGDVLGQQETA